MNQKIKILAIGASILAASVAFAQQTPTTTSSTGTTTTVVGPKHKNPIAVERELLAKLNLSSTQEDQLKPVLKIEADSLKELRQSAKTSNLPIDQVKEKRKAIQKTYMESLKTILTPAQMIQYKDLVKEMHKKEKEEKAAATGTPAGG